MSSYYDTANIDLSYLEGLSITDQNDQPDSGNYEQLVDAAAGVQRVVVTKMARDFVSGHMAVANPRGGKLVPELNFNVSRFVTWTKGDPTVVVDAIRDGRARLRVDAAMSVGKSTRLAPYIARELNQRVLIVGLDAVNMQLINIYCTAAGIGSYSRRPTSKKKSHVMCMTYGDFASNMFNKSLTDALFSKYDTIIFDESSSSNERTFVAKRCFAVYANSKVNLICCSATLRDDGVVREAAGQGTFKMLTQDMSLSEAIASGKLLTEYMVDKTLVLYPTDDGLDTLAEHYEAAGFLTMRLDSALTVEEVEAANAWLSGDSLTQRVLLGHTSISLSFNLAVSYAVIWPFEEHLVIEGSDVRSVLVPMDVSTVRQAMARTGRGIVEGSGGVVMSGLRSETVELHKSLRFDAFVWMHACGIKPMKKSALWEDLYKEFPDGLDPYTAVSILKMGVPGRVALAYLAKDGLVAERFGRAVNFFSQPDHSPEPSRYANPVGYDSWVEESMFGNSSVTVRVPYHAKGMLAIQMQAMYAFAENMINLPRWRYEGVMEYGDGYDSDNYSNGRSSPRMGRIKRIENPVRVADVVVDPVVRVTFDTPESRRSGTVYNSDRFAEAFREMESLVRDYVVPTSPALGVTGFTNESVAVSLSEVNSPGGSLVCELTSDVAAKLNLGRALNPIDMASLVDAVGEKEVGFATSRVFDSFSSPWDSYIKTLLDRHVVDELVRTGRAGRAYRVLSNLYKRFATEMSATLSASNLFKKRFFRIFRVTPSPAKILEAVKAGKFDDIAQSQGFLDRLEQLKTMIDSALVFAEGSNIYLPMAVSEAQRVIPAGGSEILGTVGRGLITGMGQSGVSRQVWNPRIPPGSSRSGF